MRRPNRQFVAGHLEGDLSARMALLIAQSRLVGPRFRLRVRLARRGRLLLFPACHWTPRVARALTASALRCSRQGSQIRCATTRGLRLRYRSERQPVVQGDAFLRTCDLEVVDEDLERA